MSSRDIKNLEDIPIRVLEVLDDAMEDLAKQFLVEANNNIESGDFSPAVGKGALFKGTLLNSARFHTKPFEKTVIYDAPHASPVEYGSRPHTPPVDPLIEWCREKLGMDEQKARKTGWALQKHIAKYGTMPRPFFRQAYATVTAFQSIDKAIRTALKGVKGL